MLLQQSNLMVVPEETARVAKTSYRKDNLAIHLRHELAGIYRDELFADLYPVRGQAAEAPWRLTLVTVLQFAEDLPDREAAHYGVAIEPVPEALNVSQVSLDRPLTLTDLHSL